MTPVNMSNKVAITGTAQTAPANGLLFGFLNAGSGAVSVQINDVDVDGSNTNTGCSSVCIPIGVGQTYKYSGTPTAVELSYAPYL